MSPPFFQDIDRFVVGDGGVDLAVVVPDHVVAGNIDACAVALSSSVGDFGNALIAVYDRNILMAEISVVIV